ncbi:MAG: sugar-binding domain-containing protein, partial [Nitrososphaera sp.]
SRETRLLHAFALKEAFVVEVATRASIRDELGAVAAGYLDRWLCDGSLLAIAGGRQTWSVIRNLSPRNVRLNIMALGYGQHDPVALHTHPNTLLTLAWLLYAPRAQAHLVGSSKFKELWRFSDNIGAVPKYFVVASCSLFSASSPFAELLGKDVTNQLLDEGVAGDFAYSFFRNNGRLVNIPTVAGVDQSVISPETLRTLTQRSDARVILIAGGTEKASVAAWALKNELCNTLIVDSELADQLLAGRDGGANAD